MATTANPPPGATAANANTNDPFTSTPSHAHPAPLRYAPFDNEQFASYSTNSPSQARRALEAHLKDTDRRIQDASKLGTTLLSQRKELAARLKEVEDLQKDNEVPADLREKLAELEKEYNEVGRESARAFLPKSKSTTAEGAVPTVFSSHARDSPSKVSAPSRRQRNQPANRFHDIEFATEISTQLLAQVRQLQAALAEKDEELQNVTARKTQLEDEHVNILQKMKQMDDTIQSYRDDNWDLQTKIQDLEASLKESDNGHQRLNNMLKATQTEKSTAQRELEDLRVAHDKAIDEHTSSQRQQEGDLHTLRRDAANHDNEKLSLQRKIEELTGQNTELAKAVSYRLMNQSSQHFQPGSRADRDSDSNDDGDMDHSDPTSPIKGTPARAGMLESETLKSSLNHAHRMIQNLKNNIHREKTEKLELKRMLSDARDELEKKRETGAGGMTAANMSKKRRSEAETVKFRKPSRPERLGANRTATTEILEDEPDWEDHEDPSTPSKSRFAAPAAAGAAAASAIMPGAFNETESSDAFETADERSRETATETEAFQTGAESMGDDSDDLTETETGVQRSGTIRQTASPNTAGSRPNVTRDRISYMSTASTSADDSESDPEVVRTPVQLQGPKYRIRVSRGPNSRSRPTDLFSDSPVSSAGTGTPQLAGKSLGDELDALDDGDSVEGTPDSRRSAGSRTASPETTRVASVEREFPGDEGAAQSIEDAEREDHEHLAIGSPFSSPVKSPKSTVGRSALANQAMLAHETAAKKPAMVDSGMMTDPWKPEKEIVIQHVAAEDIPHDEDAHKGLKERAGDVLGGALAGIGLGGLGGNDDAQPSEEKDAVPRSMQDDSSDLDFLGEPKTLRERDFVHGNSSPAVEKPRQDTVPAAEMADEPKVLRESVHEPPQPTRRAPAVPLQTSTISTQETEPVHVPAPVVRQPEPIALQMSSVQTLETEPVDVPAPAVAAPVVKEAEPVALQMSSVQTLETEPVHVPAPAGAVPVVKEAEPVAFEMSGVETQETEPISPARPSSSRGLEGLTDAASHNKEALAAVGVAGAAGAVIGAKSAVEKVQPLDFSAVVTQELEPVEPERVVEAHVTPLLPRRSSRRMDELYAADGQPQEIHAAETSDLPVRVTDAARAGTGFSAGQTPQLLRTRSRSMPANQLRPKERSDVPDAVEPRVYGGGKGAGNIPTLVFGPDDDEERTPTARTPAVKAPLPTSLPRQLYTPDSEGLIPTTEPLKIRKPMADGGSQTMVSGDEIEQMLRDKSAPSTGLSLGAGALAGAGAGYLAGHNHRGSVDANAPADSPLRAPRRPNSSGSMRNKGAATPPPLPADHTLKIAAAGGKPTTPGAPASSGSMGPPTMPASSYKQPLSKTPTGGSSMHATVSRSISKDGPTPRGAPRSHASPGGVSRRTSVSSFASELDERFNIQRGQFAYPDDLPPTTDPRMIQAITQTMIGEYLWKYTRRAGSRTETSNTRHRRFFWVHPYTRTLYWSERDPSTAPGTKMMKAKSLPIEAVRVISDDNAYPPGLHRKSLVVVTPGREIVFTAPTGQRHETWFNALSYLLLRTEHERAEVADDLAAGTEDLDPEDLDEFNPRPWSIRRSISRMTGRSGVSHTPSSTAGRNASPSVRARSATPSAAARLTATPTPTLRPSPRAREASFPQQPASARFSSITSKFRQNPGSLRGSFASSSARPGASSAMSTRSGVGSENAAGGARGGNGEVGVYDASVVSESAEDLRAVIEQQEREAERVENVRSCCDGKHDVGSLASRKGRHGSFMGRQGHSHGHAHGHAHAHAHPPPPRAEPMASTGRPRRGE